MILRGRHRLSLCAVSGAFLLAVSCGSTGPQPPQPGSPAFIWGVARDSYKAGDYATANENLAKLAQGKSEFATRAAPIQLLLGTGMAKGYIDLAAKFDTGAKANRNNPGVFRKQMSAFRSQARALSTQTLETVHQQMNNWKDEKITLAFPFPAGSLDEVEALKKVTQGLVMQPSEIDKVAQEMLQRGVVQVASRIAGSPKDAAKAKAAFAAEDTQVPREQFVLAIAGALYEISDLFSPTKMDEPDKMRQLCTEALQSLESVPQSKERKDLAEKIQKALKKVGGKG